jgi:PIN domain nuclease of toxin-antitoxin system
MNYLADTHVIVWALNQPDRLSPAIRGILAEPGNPIFYSPISLWELAIKYGLGKLDLRGHTPEEFLIELDHSFFRSASLNNAILASAHHLPRHHKDPFDRLLIWQAIQMGATLLSADGAIDAYVADGLLVIH